MNTKEINEFIESLDCSCQIKHKQGKLYFSYVSKINILIAIIVGIVFAFIYAYFLKDSIINQTPSLKNHRLGNVFDPDITGVISFFAMTFFTCSIIKSFKVIDFEQNIMYNEIILLGLSFKFNTIHKKNLIQISNSSIPISSLFNSPADNKNSDYTHNYYISFLTDNGEIIDFVKLGSRKEINESSIKLAKFISENWNIPLFENNNKKQIKSLEKTTQN